MLDNNNTNNQVGDAIYTSECNTNMTLDGHVEQCAPTSIMKSYPVTLREQESQDEPLSQFGELNMPL